MTTNIQLKRIGAIVLTDRRYTDGYTTDDQESISDSDFDESTFESDDTSAEEHISAESDASYSDVEENDLLSMATQPDTVEKAGVVWSIHPTVEYSRLPATNIIKVKPGFTTKVKTVLGAFKLFFTNEIVDEIVFYTNRYAERCFTEKEKSKSDLHRWKRIDRVELEAFIGLLIHAGLNRNNHELLSVLWDISRSPPIYRATMPLH